MPNWPNLLAGRVTCCPGTVIRANLVLELSLMGMRGKFLVVQLLYRHHF